MKLAINFLLLISFGHAFACDWKNEQDKFISLSSATTYLMKELGLLNKQVIAISKYHSIDVDQFSGEQWGGGNFLSQKKLRQHRSHIFFIDESRNLSMSVRRGKIRKSFSIKTSGLGPIQVNDLALKSLSPFIVNCEKQITKLNLRVKRVQELIETAKFGRVLFFMGEIKENKRLPNLLMVNDSFVKLLLSHRAIETFSSKLAYVNWSVKEMNKYQSFKKIGLVGKKRNKFVVPNKKGINIYDPLALLPGLSQILFIEKLIAHKSML